MSNFNSSSLQGNLVDDPKIYPGENPVARFTIANNTGYGDNRRTNFVDCVAFGKQVETIEAHFTKGKQIIVTGQLIQNKWTTDEGENRSRLEIRLNNFQGFSFVSGNAGGGEAAAGADAAPAAEAPAAAAAGAEAGADGLF